MNGAASVIGTTATAMCVPVGGPAWAGAVLVPENPAIKDEDLRHVLQDYAPQALILDRDVAERLEAQHCGLENAMPLVFLAFIFECGAGLLA